MEDSDSDIAQQRVHIKKTTCYLDSTDPSDLKNLHDFKNIMNRTYYANFERSRILRLLHLGHGGKARSKCKLCRKHNGNKGSTKKKPSIDTD